MAGEVLSSGTFPQVRSRSADVWKTAAAALMIASIIPRRSGSSLLFMTVHMVRRPHGRADRYVMKWHDGLYAHVDTGRPAVRDDLEC